ncbi:MAG: hypothetical protein ABL997_03920 [Planctomycetota bacterium]
MSRSLRPVFFVLFLASAIAASAGPDDLFDARTPGALQPGQQEILLALESGRYTLKDGNVLDARASDPARARLTNARVAELLSARGTGLPPLPHAAIASGALVPRALPLAAKGTPANLNFDGVVARAGEDPLAVQAMQLELRLALEDDPAARERAVADLALACAGGRGSTYAQACASAALALAVPRTDRREADVRVEVQGETRELHLVIERADAGRARFLRSGEVVVRGPKGVSLLVRVTALRSARGSSHPAWKSPIAVERALHVLPNAIDAAACERALHAPLDATFLLATEPLPAGRPVLLVVRATSPRSLRHVVLECPLPCGFELSGASRDVERLAAHIAFVADLEASRTFERRLLLVPTTPGRFAWPPTIAAPMYAGGLDGGSAGSFVEVVAPAKGTEPAFADWVAPRAPMAEPHAAADGKEPIDELFACWQLANDGTPDDEELDRRTARALGFDPAAANPWTALVALDDWLHDVGGAREEVNDSEAFESWLVTLLLDTFRSAMGTSIPTQGTEAATQIEAANDALVHVADQHEATFRRLELLRRAMAGAPDTVATVLDELPEDPEELEGWPGAIELLHAALVHADGHVREAAFERMTRERQATLPLAVILLAQSGEWDEEFVRGLVASERHGKEFELELRNPDLAFAHRFEWTGVVPTEWWLRLPLSVFELLADDADEDERDGTWSVAQLADRVARGVATDRELVAGFAAADEAFRAVLARALRQRGVRDVGALQRENDATFAAWANAIALGQDEVDGAIVMLRTFIDEEGELLTNGPEAAIGRFVRECVADRGTPQQVYAVARQMDETMWIRVWARFDADQRVQLVDQFQRNLSDAFVPATDQESEAMWRFLQRSKNVEGAMANLATTTAGVRCARRHVEAGDGEELAELVRTEFAEALDLDVATLEAPIGDECAVLLATLRRSQRDAELTSRERAVFDRMRRHLGASPPLR